MPTERRLLDQNGNTIKIFHYDHATDKVTIQHHEDVQPVMDAVSDIRSGHQYGQGRELKLKASIPLTLINKWRIDDGVDVLRLPRDEFAKYLRKKVNGNYSKFRARDKVI